jgi:hypothetical protein
MSVECEAYVGYTVTLKTNLNGDDFDFFNEFLETHDEYNQYDCKDKVLLVVDGMCGEYARLVFVDYKLDEYWCEGKNYFILRDSPIPEEIYNELNKAYNVLYNKDLDVEQIEYALWFLFC